MTEHALKPGWQWVTFGDVVHLNTDRVADPLAASIERYVGLEHITPEDLRIRSWGLVVEGTTFTNYFKPGQVLFGKRRAYQRKVAVADFAGVCSSDIYVFEPRDERLLPELLPFICQTEAFYQHAVGTSAGSLSPRTNWEQLAKYEFALPPVEEQRRIVTLLLSMLNCGHSMQYLVDKTMAVEKAFLGNAFGNYFSQTAQTNRWNRIALNQLAYIQSGVAKGRQVEPGVTTNVPYITVSNVQDGYLDITGIDSIVVEQTKVDQYRLHFGDVLMTEGGDPDKLGRGTIWQDEIAGCIHQNHIFAIRPDVLRLNSWYLAAVARSPYGKQYFLSCAKRTSNLATINKMQVGNFLIPIPDMKTQKDIVSDWLSLRNGARQVTERFEQTKQMQFGFLNSTLGKNHR